MLHVTSTALPAASAGPLVVPVLMSLLLLLSVVVVAAGVAVAVAGIDVADVAVAVAGIVVADVAVAVAVIVAADVALAGCCILVVGAVETVAGLFASVSRVAMVMLWTVLRCRVAVAEDIDGRMLFGDAARLPVASVVAL